MERRGGGLYPCAHCGGQPIVLVSKEGRDRTMRIECCVCHVTTPNMVYRHEDPLTPYDYETGRLDLGLALDMQMVKEQLRGIWNRRPE